MIETRRFSFNKRLTRRLLRHHLPLMILAAITMLALYLTRPGHDAISKISFATAYPALILLVVTLSIGPWNLLRRHFIAVSSDLRRDIGIWAGVLGIAHSAIGLCVHMRGRPWLYFVYPSNSHHWFPIRHDIFGFANETGLIGTFILIALFATSNDYFLRRLGTLKWKQLQQWNYALWLLVILHAAGYQTIEKQRLPFVTVLVLCVTITLALQALGWQRHRTEAARKRECKGVERIYEP